MKSYKILSAKDIEVNGEPRLRHKYLSKIELARYTGYFIYCNKTRSFKRPIRMADDDYCIVRTPRGKFTSMKWINLS